MKPQKHIHSSKEFSLEYLVFGKGEEAIVTFHGFGRKAEDFLIFTQLLKPHQKLISINLFQHGQSLFPNSRITKKPLKHQEWKVLMEEILKKEKVEKVTLMGYSLGGKVAMETALLLSDHLKSLILIAPDGIKINRLYQFSSQTGLGRAVYRTVVKYPQPFFRMADVLKGVGIISGKIHRFVHFHMDTYEKRKLVYDTWLIYRRFEPDLQEVASLMKKKHIQFTMIFGKYDRIIPPRLGRKMAKIVGDESVLHVVESGHLLLEQPTVDYMSQHNLWPK